MAQHKESSNLQVFLCFILFYNVNAVCLPSELGVSMLATPSVLDDVGLILKY